MKKSLRLFDIKYVLKRRRALSEPNAGGTKRRDRWMVVSGYSLALAVMVGLTSLIFRQFRIEAEADRLETQSYQVMTQFDRVLSDLRDAETGQRGYFITGDERYLTPHHVALDTMQQRLDSLRELTRGSPGQQRLEIVERLVAERLELAKEAIALRQTEGQRAAEGFVQSGRGKAVMDRLGSQIAEALQEEEEIIREQSAVKQASRDKLLTAVVVGGLFSFALLGVLLLYVGRESAEAARAGRSMSARYGVAIGAVAIAVFALILLQPLFEGHSPPLVLLTLATAAAAWHGGLGPGLVATALGVLLTWWLPHGPYYRVAVPDAAEATRMLLTVFSGASISALAEAMHRTVSRQRIDHARLAVEVQKRRETEERLRATFDNAGVGIVEVSEDDRLIAVNDHVCKVLGYRREELLGRTIHALTYPDDRRQSDELNAQLHDGRSDRLDYEKRYLKRDGSPLWVHMTVSPVRDAAGKWLRSVATVEDISRRKSAEEGLRLQSAALEAAANAIVITDPRGKILWANPAFAAMTGYSREEALGHTLRFLKSGEQDAQFYQGMWETIRRGEHWHGEIVNRRKDGTLYTEEMTISPVRNESGGISQYIAVKQDVSQRKAFETELAAARTAAEQAKHAAEQANVAKSQFLANMSHELRTPMNAIMGMTELALQEDLAPGVRDSLQTAKDSADTLLTLINEVLDLSRVEAGMLVLESAPFRLRALLDSTMRAIAVRAYEKGLELACDVSPSVPDRVIGDPLRLRQIVTNLVGNAIKFTHHGEIVVQVELDKAEEEQIMLRFAVVDTGIGIAPEHQAKIFAPFAQADASTTRRYGGTGLGLSIVAGLVEMLGGRMWLESDLEVGSTFYFTVLLERQHGPEPAEPEGLDLRHLENVPVLIADTNTTTRRVLHRILAGWSMRPALADDGPAALARLRHSTCGDDRPHLVFADAFLPGSEGNRLVEEIRADRSLNAVVILMASPPEKQRLIRTARLREGVVYLEKPISESAVSAAVSQAMGLSLRPELTGQSQREAAGASRPLRILLAEDTPANQKLACRILEKRGHRVEVAENGRDALEQLRCEEFDAVLMDVQMPIMDGFQATAAIRTLPSAKAGVPIIAMTAHALKGDQERCLAAGMNAYLSKPINAQELIALVERFASPCTLSQPDA